MEITSAHEFSETFKTASEQLGVGLKPEDVARWLPFQVDLTTVDNFLGNLTLYPNALPLNERELFIHQAVIREIFRKASPQDGLLFERNTPVVLPTEIGRISRNEWESVLIFLDGIAPVGVLDLLDYNQQKLATLFCFSTSGVQSGKIAEVKFNMGLTNPQKIILNFGDLVLFPAAADARIELLINCSPKVKIGESSRAKVITNPGVVGLVFDCRGRPFEGPDLTLSSRQLVKKWQNVFKVKTSF